MPATGPNAQNGAVLEQIKTCLKLSVTFKMTYSCCFSNGPSLALFLFIFGLFEQTLQFFTTNQIKYVMSIQYKALGFEITTSQT